MRLKLPLDRLAAHLVGAIAEVLCDERPDMVLAQGDTTTVVATALACSRRDVAFGHVEAGLRTGRLFAPFPEEANRVVASHLSTDPFRSDGFRPRQPDERRDQGTKDLRHGQHGDRRPGVGRPARHPDRRRARSAKTARSGDGPSPRFVRRAAAADLPGGPRICTTALPTSSFSGRSIPIPSVRPVVEELMTAFPRVHLCRPLAYGPFVSAMKRAAIILTDSGGVQEEAPALGRPVLVMRNESERPEAIKAGVARLVGQDPEAIVAVASRLLEDPAAYRSMARGVSPYGDGRASARIVSRLRRHLGVGRRTRESASLPLSFGRQR